MLKKALFCLLFLGMITLMPMCHAAEQIGYITDAFEVPARTGPASDRKILALLKTGSPVKVLERTEDGWSRILMKDDKEAWVLTRYILTDRKPWSMQAEAFKQENDDIKQELNNLMSDKDSAAGRAISLDKDLKETNEELKKVTLLYDELKKGSTEYVELKERFTQTQSSLENTVNELSELKTENEQLKSSQRMQWFAIGAIVVLFGFLIGFVMGRQNKKRSYY